MILGTARSKNSITIRLTDERWFHITSSHKEIDTASFLSITQTIKTPDIIFQGDHGELLAVKKQSRRKNWVVVVYTERDLSDGFVLTAYLTTDFRWLLKRKIIWNKPS